MGWRDLLKSKSLRLKPDPRVRWFGKLPTYPDYYSSPAGEEWTVEFNEWVMKGCEIHHARVASTDGAIHRMPICACVIRLPKSEVTVLAAILDFGGDMRGRQFPMCMYVGIPTHSWPGPTSDRVTGALRVLNRLLLLRHELARFINSPGPLEAVLGGRVVSLDDLDEEYTDSSWTAGARDHLMTDWFVAVQDILKIQRMASWVGKVDEWGDRLVKHEGADFEPTLRFPLAMRVPAEIQVAGWIRWLEQRMDLGRRSLSLVISGDLEYESGFLAVIARQIVPDDFLLATSQAQTLSYLDDLAAVELPEHEEDGTDSSLQISEECPERWLEFVEASPAKT